MQLIARMSIPFVSIFALFLWPGAALAASGSTLAQFAASPNGYAAIVTKSSTFVPDCTPTVRTNCCVAYMASLLTLHGYKIPSMYNGRFVGGQTKPFMDYIQYILRFAPINDWRSLQAGDIVFTQPDGESEGMPSHSYLFHSWYLRSQGKANVVDNQGSVHVRDVLGSGDFNWSPFLRAFRPN